MTNLDEDGYPFDNSYINRTGPTPAWDCWNSGDYEYAPVTFPIGEGLQGNPEEQMYIWTPVSGGYGADKHTFVAEFPIRFITKTGVYI